MSEHLKGYGRKSMDFIVFSASNNSNSIALCRRDKDKEDYLEIDVVKIPEFKVLYHFNAHGDWQDHRIAISDDGEYVATSIWEDFGKGHVHVYKNGCEVLDSRKFNRIDRIAFSDRNDLRIMHKEKTYLMDVSSGEIKDVQNYYDMIHNAFGEDIILKHDNMIYYAGKKIKSSTFAYFDVIGTPDGLLASEVSNCLIRYDASGNKVWESATREYGHIINAMYDSIHKVIYCYTFRGVSIIVDYDSGEVLKSFNIEPAGFLFFLIDEQIYIFKPDGKCFKVDQNGLGDLVFDLDSLVG